MQSNRPLRHVSDMLISLRKLRLLCLPRLPRLGLILLAGMLLWLGLLSSDPFALRAQAGLSGVFWFDLDINLSITPSNTANYREESNKIEELVKASQRFVLKEASYVFHGMIYGFQAIYVPPDRFHRQEESFLIIPEYTRLIAPRDLEIYHIGNNGNRYYYSIRKELSSFERSNMAAWQQGDKTTLHGIGTIPYAAARSDTDLIAELRLEPELFVQLRKAAIDNAIKEAIRSYFRKVIRTKPAKIRVNLALSQVPQIGYTAQGEIQAKVHLHMAQYSIDRYQTR